MKLSKWKEKGRSFPYKSHNIFFVNEGQGEVILLIHGFPTASWDWSHMWDGLVANYQLMTLDMIGFGFSDKPRPYNYSILDQADIIESLLVSEGVDTCHILSHNYGDTVAQELLARYEERKEAEDAGLKIKSVCFLNGGLFPETHHPLLIQKILMGPLGPLVSKLLNRKKLEKNLKGIFGKETQPSDETLDAFWELISTNEGLKISHLLIRYMRERIVHRERWVSAMQKTAIPLRLIDGLEDPISGKHMADRYKELIPNADVVGLKDIGHFPNVEAPDMVLYNYLNFVKSIN